MPPVSPAQIRAARALLDWSITDLSHAAPVSILTVKGVENGGMSSVSQATIDVIRMTFEAQGVHFSPDDGYGIGVRVQTASSS